MVTFSKPKPNRFERFPFSSLLLPASNYSRCAILKDRHVWCYPLSGFEILWTCSIFVNSYLSTINICWVFTMLIIHKKGKLWITHITEPVVVYIINPPDCLFHFDYWKINHFLAVNQMPQRSSSWFQLSCLFRLFFDL